MSASREALERAEQRLAEIPALPTGLPPDLERSFQRARRRIGRHHRSWRAGMPALDTLFDDDAHRARALAGSVCTELEDVLQTWGRLRAGDGKVDAEAKRFVDETARAWQAGAEALAGPLDWEPDVEELYRGFVRQLVERGRERGHAALRGEAGAPRTKPGRLQLLVRRLVRAPLLLARRFFRPDP